MQFPADVLRPCWFLAGPTASGKTAVGLELAERLGAEIVSLDSMSIYRGMDIGTAKPSRAEQAQVPHHLIDLIEPHDEFSLAEYLRGAESACRDILARGRIPLFVGGTGLYLRGVLRGLFQGPAADWGYRRTLERDTAGDPAALHARLQAVDPTSAARLHPHDTRRLIRALEVYHLTGVPLSTQQRQLPRPAVVRSPHVYWLSPERACLYARIDRRVEQMFEAGLVAEVQRLLGAERPPGRTARQALGYKEVIDHLSGMMTRADTIGLIQLRSRQFAKRQHTWFRNLEECTPIAISAEETPSDIARKILEQARTIG